jgi:hypothetical protein
MKYSVFATCSSREESVIRILVALAAPTVKSIDASIVGEAIPSVVVFLFKTQVAFDTSIRIESYSPDEIWPDPRSLAEFCNVTKSILTDWFEIRTHAPPAA